MKVNRMLTMTLLHFIAMYFLMYSMVNAFNNIFLNINNAYMAAIMTAPMLIIEVLLMGSMYKNIKFLSIMLLSGIVLLVVGFLFIRQQAFVYDKEFIRSMIPHHSGAILMCERSKIQDKELQQLCKEIITSQQEEINQMKDILNRLN
jgi:uncharacterized protein (DUF305 family)